MTKETPDTSRQTKAIPSNILSNSDFADESFRATIA
jgi:hypothetical protein